MNSRLVFQLSVVAAAIIFGSCKTLETGEDSASLLASDATPGKDRPLDAIAAGFLSRAGKQRAPTAEDVERGVPASFVFDKDMPILQQSPDSFDLADTHVSADLRRYDTPIKNQGSRLTCTAFAVVAAMENKTKRETDEDFDLSEEQYWSRYGAPTWDFGLQYSGNDYLVYEKDWPYHSATIATTDWKRLVKLTKYVAMPTTNDMMTALDNGNPVIFATEMNDSWNLSTGWVSSAGAANNTAHAVAIVGYSKTAAVGGGGFWVFKNSYGKYWGDDGYGYLPFDYCSTKRCVAYEARTIARVGPAAGDDSPVPTPTPTPTPNQATLNPKYAINVGFGSAVANGKTWLTFQTVTAGGRAAKAGIVVGDYLMTVNGYDVRSLQEYYQAIDKIASTGTTNLNLQIWRNQAYNVTISVADAAPPPVTAGTCTTLDDMLELLIYLQADMNNTALNAQQRARKNALQARQDLYGACK